jgi:transposase
MEQAKRMRRRRHDEELKRRVLSECAAPDASVARVALAHSLNANLVHKWRRQAGAAATATKLETFVPVTVTPAPGAGVAESIQLELQRGAVSVRVNWPLSAASSCAAWLREIWR